jgi:hypothetical protein
MHGPVDEAYPMARNQGVNQAFSLISSGTVSAVQLPYEALPQIAVGLIVGAFMVFARARWAWFPFHWVGIMPIEYFAGSFVSLMIVYPLKLIVLRVGGTTLYRKSFLFAVGFLTGFGLECMLEGVLALAIGPRNIPYP